MEKDFHVYIVYPQKTKVIISRTRGQEDLPLQLQGHFDHIDSLGS